MTSSFIPKTPGASPACPVGPGEITKESSVRQSRKMRIPCQPPSLIPARAAAAFSGVRQLIPALHQELQQDHCPPDCSDLHGKSPSAFRDLKTRFTEAPILVQPDPKLQFIVKVDASDFGAGSVLSQRLAADKKLRPCAFFSCHLERERER